MTEIFYRNLPHIHARNAAYFITFRLAGSLPMEALAKMRADYEMQVRFLEEQFHGQALYEERYNLQKKFFARYDKLLDRVECGPSWLAESRFAEIVAHEIHALEPEHYHLYAYSILSNHVHLLFDQQDIPEPKPLRDGKHYTALSHAMRLLKGRTGYACARLLGQKGDFWQHESYDHLVRDEKEFERIVGYITNNPVNAGLVKNWQDWPYTYCRTSL